MKIMDKIKIGIIISLAGFLLLRPALSDDTRPELTVYTYDSFAADWGPGPQIKAAFEQECECILSFVGIDTSLGILGRIRLEGQNSKADVILGLDTAQSDIA
ncbi:MAG: thiamine ABC transporter substrate-binding protein, partial [Candidatus Puniceispirillales bacterium]